MDAARIFTALLEPAGRANPYPLYSALHELGPAAPAGPGFVVVAGYQAVNGVLRDPEFKVADVEYYDRVMPAWREHESASLNSILSLNPPDHARIRGLISRAFTQRRIAGLAAAVESLTDQLLDGMASSGSGGSAVEFMAEFAFELPVQVICELLGIDEPDREPFRPLGRALTATLEPTLTAAELTAADAAAKELTGFFAGLIAERRARPTEDLISALTTISESGDGRLSQGELIDNLILLLLAGFETTTNLLGNGLQVALTDPAAAAAVRSGSVPPEAFVQEVLRYDSPVQATSRRKDAAAQIAGVATRPGDEIIVLLGAANRDPRVFGAPDRFDPARAGPGPLSFGGGAHFCLGAALARLEATIAFPRLFARFPALAPAGVARRRGGLILRGFESLPVTVG